VRDWPTSGWQIDAEFPRFLPLPPVISRERDLGDSIMTAIVLAPFAERPTRFTELGRLRVQECERVVALRTELARCGAKVLETGDTLSVHPGPLHAAEIPTYGDHRMAMCFATLGLVVPGLRILDPSCVRKTFPNFFVKLASLGATILDAETRAPLAGAALLAD
jgi:3-phosphoshikimate 1-carboxyvinyltransferase